MAENERFTLSFFDEGRIVAWRGVHKQEGRTPNGDYIRRENLVEGFACLESVKTVMISTPVRGDGVECSLTIAGPGLRADIGPVLVNDARRVLGAVMAIQSGHAAVDGVMAGVPDLLGARKPVLEEAAPPVPDEPAAPPKEE